MFCKTCFISISPFVMHVIHTYVYSVYSMTLVQKGGVILRKKNKYLLFYVESNCSKKHFRSLLEGETCRFSEIAKSTVYCTQY